jgi:hypothetical protein
MHDDTELLRRRADGVEGLLRVPHHPRDYFAFEATPVRR